MSGAAPAAAHNSLTGSNPKDGASLAQSPETLRLTFLSRVDPTNTKITVTGPDDESIQETTPTFDGSKITVPLSPGPAGLYTVAYEVVSSDGHLIKGKIRFTVTVGVTPTATAEPTATATAEPPASATTTPSDVPAMDSAAGEQEESSPWWPWALGGAVVLVAALGVGLLRRRRAG